MAYELGAIFLQVIPSFEGIQAAARAQGQKAAEEWNKGYDAAEGKASDVRAQQRAQREQAQAAERRARAERETTAHERALERTRVQAAERRAIDEAKARQRTEAAEQAARQRQRAAAETHQQGLEKVEKAGADRRLTEQQKAADRRLIEQQKAQQRAEQDARKAQDRQAATERTWQERRRYRDEGWSKQETQRRARQAEAESKSFDRLTRKFRDTDVRSLRRSVSSALRIEDPEREVQKAIRASLNQARDRLTYPVEIEVKEGKAKKELAALRQQMQALSEVEIGVDIDGTEAASELAAIHTALRDLDRDDVDIEIRTRAREALVELAAVRKAINDTEDRLEKDRELKASKARERRFAEERRAEARRIRDRDLDVVRRGLTLAFKANDNEEVRRDLSDALARMQGRLRPIELTVDSSDAEVELAHIQARIAALRDAKIGIDIDAGAAAAEVAGIQAALRDLDRDDVDVDIRVDSRAALLEIGTINAAAHSLDGLSRKTRESNDQAGSAANAFRAMNSRLFALVTVGPLLIPILTGIAGAIGAIAIASIGALGAVGTLFLGLGGIGTAVGAMNDLQAEQKYGNSPRNQRSNARAVRNARYGLASARRGAADSVTSALRAQADAEKALARAQDNSRKAQEQLNDARRQARRDLEDLNNAIVSGRLNEEQAVLDLQEAAAHLNAVLEDEQATGREKRVAQLEYDQQVQSLKELRLENTRLAEEKAEADRVGIEGSDRVVAAQERIADANEAVIDAQQGIADAAQQLARARVDGAEQVRRAEEALSDALEQQSEVASGLSTAQRNLREAMDGLAPAGQAFAAFLFGLKPLLDTLRAAAQNSFLPPLQRAITLFLETYGPRLERFITMMGDTLGRMFVAIAEALASPEWQAFFDQIITYAPAFLSQWGAIFGSLATALRPMIEALLPFALEFGNGLAELAAGFAAWANSEGGREAIQGFFDHLSDISPQAMQAIGLVFEAIGLALVGLAPYTDKLLELFIGMLEWIVGLDPKVIGAVLLIIMGLIGSFQLLSTAMAGIQTTVGLIAALAGGGTALLWVIAIVAVIAVLVGGFTLLYQKSERFREGLDEAGKSAATFWTDTVLPAVSAVTDWLETTGIPAWQSFYDTVFPTLQKIGDLLYTLWWETFRPFVLDVYELLSTVLGPVIETLWTNIIQPVFSLVWSAIKGVWDIFSSWVDLVYVLVTTVLLPVFWQLHDDVVKPVWDGISTVISTVWDFLDRTVFAVVGDTLAAMGEGFETFGEVVAGVFDGIRKAAADPVNFVIEQIYNNGLRKWWNSLAGSLGISTMLPEATPVPLPGQQIARPPSVGSSRSAVGGSFASGGVLPGYTPGRDVHHFYSPTAGELHLSGGEGIIRPDALQRLGGKEWLDSVNRGAAGPGRRYADGGVVDFLKNGASFAKLMLTDPAIALDHLLRKPVEALMEQLGQSPLGQMLVELPTLLIAGLVGKAKSWAAGRQGAAAIEPSGEVAASGWSNIAIGRITSRYGPRIGFGGTFHGGTDIGGPGPIYAASAGQVLFTGPSDPRYTPGRTGNQVLLRHAGNVMTSYGHVANGGFYVNPGDVVAPGQRIALRGMTGNATGVHVHYEVWDGGKRTDPEPFMRRRGVSLGSGPVLFDDGGWLMPGLTTVLNNTGRPEPVLTSQQWDSVSNDNRRGGDVMPNATFVGIDPADIIREYRKAENDRAALAGLGGGLGL